MPEKPLISIIIPTYNRAHLLGETLESVLAQTHENWECIVVDDGSTDVTDELMGFYCERDSRIQYCQRPASRPKGANACRNYGFELSRGQFVNWFDSDDLMHPDKLSTQVDAIVGKEINFSICQTLVFKDCSKNIIGLRSKEIYSGNIFFDYLSQNITFLTQAPVWKRSFLIEHDFLFDEELHAAQEWEFHCRVLSVCSNYHVCDYPLVFVRQHFHSITYDGNDQIRNWNYYLARNKIYYNANIQMDKKSKIFLKKFLLSHFKNFVRIRSINNSLKAFRFYIYKESNLTLKEKFYAFISIISFLTFNKGEKFLKLDKNIK